jgi:hypothetical protein
MMLWLLILPGFLSVSDAQQIPDTSYVFPNSHPAYGVGKGPLVLIDAAHHNFHTRTGGFMPFARLLEQDGYRVGDLAAAVNDPALLKGCRVLVIANALHSSNLSQWALPTPSAFTGKEIELIRQWVQEGGSLLLIADHMPFAGAASELGRAFGFEFLNGFAFTSESSWPPSVYSRQKGTLLDSPVTRGRETGDKTDSVATFTGSAFRAPGAAMAVLSFLPGNWSLQPDTAWRFSSRTPRLDLEGYHQGALLEYGKGRIAVFGEAAMFTAQVVRGNMKVGMNSESAPQNARFTLNLVHWLDGKP